MEFIKISGRQRCGECQTDYAPLNLKWTFVIGCYVLLQCFFGAVTSQGVITDPANYCVQRTDGYVCYVPLSQTLQTRNGAESTCQSKNMHLPAIASVAENNAITNILNLNKYADVWLGAEETPHTFGWLDGTEVNYQGCYNQINNRDLPVEKVFDNSSPLEPQTCMDYCNSLSYKYAALENGNQCWCGNQFGSEGQSGATCNIPCAVPENNLADTCGGQSAQEILSVGGSYSNWFPGRPNNYMGVGNCAILSTSSSSSNWVDSDCRSPYGALCDIGSASASCVSTSSQPNTFTAGGRCLSIIQTPTSYFNARAACVQLGGDLAQLKTSDLNIEVANYINSSMVMMVCQGPCNFWIGLTKWTWSWISGEPFVYTNWWTNYPTGTASPSRCAAINRLDGPGAWMDQDCNAAKYFICQTSNATILTTTTTTTTHAPGNIGGKTASTKAGGAAGGGGGGGGQGGATSATGKDTEASSASKTQTWIIIGACVGGGVVLLIVIIIIAVICCRRHRNKPTAAPLKDEEPYQPDYYFGAEPEAKTVVPMTPYASDYQEIKSNCEAKPDTALHPRLESTTSYSKVPQEDTYATVNEKPIKYTTPTTADDESAFDSELIYDNTSKSTENLTK